MYNLRPTAMRIGMPIADLMRHSAERGNLSARKLEEVDAPQRRDLMARGEPFRLMRQMRTGAYSHIGLSPDRRTAAGSRWSRT